MQFAGKGIIPRLLKNVNVQVEPCEIPFAGAPLPSPKQLRAGRRNPVDETRPREERGILIRAPQLGIFYQPAGPEIPDPPLSLGKDVFRKFVGKDIHGLLDHLDEHLPGGLDLFDQP